MTKKDKTKKDKISSEQSGSTQNLQGIDQEILRLLEKRANLLKSISQNGRQGQNTVDPAQEKKLWRIWQDFFQQKGLNEHMGRKVFNLLNNMGYEVQEKSEEKEFWIQPPAGRVQIDQVGPMDILLTRLAMALAAGLNTDLRVSGAVLNDGLFEFVKAANQAGAGFSWYKGLVVHEQGQGLSFDRKSLFVGQEKINLFLLIFLAINDAGSCKFSGSSRLKIENLEQLQGLMRVLGARTVNLVPGGEGLPLKLESSAQISHEVQLPDKAESEMTAALTLALSCSGPAQEGLRIICPRDFLLASREKSTLEHVLGAKLQIDEQQRLISIQPRFFPDPAQIVFYLDPELCAPILALPQLLGGRAVLKGYFPKEQALASYVLEMLEQIGARVEISSDKISSCNGQQPRSLELDCTEHSSLLPLALGMGLALNQSMHLQVSAGEDLDFGLYLLEKIGLEHQLDKDVLIVHSTQKGTQDALRVTCPAPIWCISLALAAVGKHKFVINNPGEVTRLWPQFWALYRNCTQQSQTRKQEGQKNGSRQRKRIVD